MRLRFLWIFLAVFLALGGLPTSAQTQTTVTGRVLDPNGIPYAGARLVVMLNNPGPGSPTLTPCSSSPCPVPLPGPVTLDANGNIPGGGIQLYANASISVGGIAGTTTYSFQVNQNPGVLIPWGTGAQILTLSNVTIAGSSQNLTAAFGALPPPVLTLFGSAIGGGGINGSVVVVNGTTVTTIAQALTLLPTLGGVIDARSCAPTSLAMGNYDPGAKAVTLLLGACTYTFNQIFEEPSEQILGLNSYAGFLGTILISTNTTNGAALIRENTNGNDSTNLIYRDFALVQCATFSGCPGVGQVGISINPSQTNVSAALNQITNLDIETDGSPIVLNAPGTALNGENTIGTTLIANNSLFSSAVTPAPAISLSGGVYGVVISGNFLEAVSATGAFAISLTKGSAAELQGINITANSTVRFTNLFSNSGATQVSAIANTSIAPIKVFNDSWSDPFLPARFTVATLPSAATVGAGAVATVSDALTSTAGACVGGGSNTTIAVSNGTTWNCLQSGASSPSVQVFTNKNLASNVSVTANTLTTIDSVSPTMPSSGGPFRVLVTYSYFVSGGVLAECYVSDGTNSWAVWEQAITSNASECIGSQWSPTTYANGATPTFTVHTFNTGAATVETTGNVTGSVPSSIQVAIFTSN
jgi:hypothetical protein